MQIPKKASGLGNILVLAIGAVAVGMAVVLVIPFVVILIMSAAVMGVASSCDLPGSSTAAASGEAEVIPALDFSSVPEESRPVIESLPTPYTIPANYYEAYKAAADAYNMDWEILAAIGWRETKHGTYEPGWRENEADAMGPMQFIPAAWEHHGVYADGSPGTPPLENRNNLADAVASAANKLTDQGINTNEVEALFRYNNAMWYVNQIQEHADVLRAGDYTVAEGDGTTTNGGDGGGLSGVFSPASLGIDCASVQNINFGAAMAPDEITAGAVEFALDQVGKPYCWGGTGPHCYDCSGLLVAAYRSVGVELPMRISQHLWHLGERIPPGEEMPGDFIFFEVDMSNREDAAFGNPGHVAMVVGPGEMVEAWCTNCGPITVRGWEDRDVMGFTRPLLDERLSHHLPDVPDSDSDSDSEPGPVYATAVGTQSRPAARVRLGGKSAVAPRSRLVL